MSTYSNRPTRKFLQLIEPTQCPGKLLMSRYSVEVREVPTLSNLSDWLVVKKDKAGSAVKGCVNAGIYRLVYVINEGRTKLKAPKTYVDRSHGENGLVMGRRDGTRGRISLCNSVSLLATVSQEKTIKISPASG